MNNLIIEYLEGNNSKWEDVLNYVLPRATHVEFNILYSDAELNQFLEKYKDAVVEIFKRKKKIYASGKVLRLELSDKVHEFVRSRSFEEYKNWILEDPSFYIDDKEVIATISHEDQIYLRPEWVDLSEFANFKLSYRIEDKEEKGFWEYLKNLFRRK